MRRTISTKAMDNKPISCTGCKFYKNKKTGKVTIFLGREINQYEWFCEKNNMKLNSPPLTGWDPSPKDCPL
jgi:hypothetical protein